MTDFISQSCVLPVVELVFSGLRYPGTYLQDGKNFEL